MITATPLPTRCPLCGDPVSLGTPRQIDAGTVMAVVIEGDTWHPHLRDQHPAEWVQACEQRRLLNATLGARMGAMPRKVNGAIMRAGEDVGDL